MAVSDLSGSEQKAAMQRITNYKKETTRLTEELKVNPLPPAAPSVPRPLYPLSLGAQYDASVSNI